MGPTMGIHRNLPARDTDTTMRPSDMSETDKKSGNTFNFIPQCKVSTGFQGKMPDIKYSEIESKFGL